LNLAKGVANCPPPSKTAMTPEQLQQYVDAALKQRDQFSLVFYPLTIVLSIGGAWLISYVREKGKNLATKEDVSEITRKVESIKTDLAAKQHFSQIRYARELKTYEELWPKLCELESIVLSLRSGWGFSSAQGMSEEEETLKRKQQFGEAHRAFFLAVSHSRPFYPAEVWDELNMLIMLCWGEAVQWGFLSNLAHMRARENREDYYDKAEKNADAIKKQIDIICEVIRTRLNKFDSI
jgi:hypothetical protein